jgi:O-antigen ligase
MKLASIVMMLLAGAAAAWFVPAKSFERLSTTTTEITEGGMTGRMSIWQSGLRAVPARPLHGYGPAGWFPVAGKVFGRIRGPHSTYLSILVEEGLIGLFLFLSLFAVVLKRLRTLPTFERRIGLTLLATLAIANTPLGWDVSNVSWLVLALLAAWSVVLARPPAAPAYPQAVRPTLRRPGHAPEPAIVQ